jgi:hypothetical protein
MVDHEMAKGNFNQVKMTRTEIRSIPAQLDMTIKENCVLLAGDCFISLAAVANLLQWFDIKCDLC